MKFSLKSKMGPRWTLDSLGWAAAGVLSLIFLSSGFGPSTETYASVDLASLIDNSAIGKASQAKYEAKRESLISLLEFMRDNQVMSKDQGPQLIKLWTSDAPTAADTASLKDLKTQIMANSKAYEDLQNKTTLTSADQTTLDTDRQEIQATQDAISSLAQQFSANMNQLQQQSAADVLTKVKAAAQQVGKAQGYTVVFINTSAPYCDHDITQAVMDSLNKPGS